MLTSRGLLCAMASAFLFVGPTNAALILSDNFDSYPDQASFEVAWPAIGTVAPISCLLSTAQSVSPPNGVQVPGNVTTGQYRNRRSFTESGFVDTTHQIVWSFDFYDSAPTASPARNSCNLQDTTTASATNQLISMGFNNNQTG